VWLYIPKKYCPSSLVSVDSISVSNLLLKDLAQSVTWRGKLIHAPSWSRVLRTVPWMMHLSGQILKPSQAKSGVRKLISSLPDSLVSRGRLRVRGKKQTTIDGSGQTLKKSFAKLGRSRSSWKMSRKSATEESTWSLDRWPRWGSMRNGGCFLQNKLEPLIEEGGSSSLRNWPTPLSTEQGEDLGTLFRRFEMGNRHLKLGTLVKIWPTPLSGDYGNRSRSKNWKGTDLVSTVKDFYYFLQDREILRGGSDISNDQIRLNPRFVEVLMGHPRRWATIRKSSGRKRFERWEMASSRILQHLLIRYYQTV